MKVTTARQLRADDAFVIGGNLSLSGFLEVFDLYSNHSA